ncbi:MAG: molybdopterin-binding protein [Kineosporiaceae bacterium]
MTTYRVRLIADLLGVSDDTVRRWADSGRLPASRDEAGRVTVTGADLAAFADDVAARTAPPLPRGVVRTSARNRLTGLVTQVHRDGLMARVEMRCGPFRLVSLMTKDAADELGLEPGALAVAAVEAHDVAVEVPGA